ncbi:MAG: endo-1,4-beta-xylanase [Verrucomicrobiae bacterium]
MKYIYHMLAGLMVISLNAATLDELWQNPAVEQRIADGIRMNRMDEVVLKFIGADGLPLTNVTVKVEQTRHDFLFGVNSFMLGGFPTPEENLKYEQAYTTIFNYTTVPFYWSDLEPEPGKLRFAKDSPVIYRRPPPDAVVEFCQKHEIEMKGHPLVWAQWYPKWRPDDPLEVMVRVEQRISEIAARYGDSIKRWEVVNEPCERRTWEVRWCNLPEDYVFLSLGIAAKLLPAGDRMMLNEATTFSWVEFYGTESRYYRLIREMLGRGARVDEIGFQFHITKEKVWHEILNGQDSIPASEERLDERLPRVENGYYFTPANIFKVLDQYSSFGRPLAITEITIPTLPNTPEGERDQATVARNFYRLWFSHPNVNAITWWNLVDGTAAKGDDKWNAGLVHRDFSPKLAYQALDQLINHDWKTKFQTNSTVNGEVAFRGFLGDYTIIAQVEGKTVKQTLHLKKGAASNEWSIKF